MNRILLATLALATWCSSASAQLPTNIETMLLHRVQLMIDVCDVADAETDDPVYAYVDAPKDLDDDGTLDDNKFYLNLGKDDFERNSKNTFLVTLPGVELVSDIKKLTIGKDGTDGLCISKIELRLNNRHYTVFLRRYDSGHWIDGNEGYKPEVTQSSSRLRDSATWNLGGTGVLAMCVLPSSIEQVDLEAMIEARIGNMIANPRSSSNVRALYWGEKSGEKWTALKRIDSNTMEGDLDLHYSMAGTDPDVDVDFWMDVSCAQGKFRLETYDTRFDVDAPWYVVLLTGNVIDAVTQVLIGSSIVLSGGINQMIEFEAAFCPSATFDAAGTLKFNWNPLPISYVLTGLCPL